MRATALPAAALARRRPHAWVRNICLTVGGDIEVVQRTPKAPARRRGPFAWDAYWTMREEPPAMSAAIRWKMPVSEVGLGTS